MGGNDRGKVYSIAIELTAYCNQKCDYCYNPWREDGNDMRAPRGDTWLARIDKLTDQLEIDHFTLTGGEPFAHHDVFRIIEHVRARGPNVQIISNGGLIDDEIAARLAPSKPSYVQVAFNGPDAALHEELVGEGWFDKTMEGVRALKRHGVPVVGCIVVNKKNAHRVGETLELFRSLEVKQISLSRFSPAGYATSFAAQLLCTRDELTTAFEQAHPYAQQGMRLHVTMPVPPCSVEVERFPALRFGSCAIDTEYQEFAVGPDGRLKNCTLHEIAIGGVPDILDPSVDLRTLLQAPEVREYKKKLPEFCEGCLHASSCGGGCGAAAYWVSGDARAFPDPFVWQHVDDELAARLEAARDGGRDRKGRRHLEVVL